MATSPAPPIHPLETYLLVTALPDTAPVGHGTVPYSRESGHISRARRGLVYGQRFRVDGIGGNRSARIDTVRRWSSGEVVIVPWDYGADCGPTPWGLSARFVRPGTEAFVVGETRGERWWYHLTPTLDTYFGGGHVYPHQALAFTDRIDPFPGELTARELFVLTEALPPECQWLNDPQGALKRLINAKQAHAALLGRHPVEGSMIAAEVRAQDARNGTASDYLREICAEPGSAIH